MGCVIQRKHEEKSYYLAKRTASVRSGLLLNIQQWTPMLSNAHIFDETKTAQEFLKVFKIVNAKVLTR